MKQQRTDKQPKPFSSPNIPPRKHDWEAAYLETITRHNALSFEWGRSDCLIVSMDLCLAMTGVDPMRGLRRYSTAKGAFKLLLKHGFRDVEQALNAVFPQVPISGAMRGDCGVLEQIVDGQISLAAVIIIQGHMAVGKSENGPVIVSLDRLKSTFAIGRR